MNAFTGYLQGMQASEMVNTTKARNALSQALQGGDMRSAGNAFAQLNPEAAYQMQQPKQVDRAALGGLVRGVLSAPEDQRPQAYAMAVQQAQAMGANVPPELAQYPGDQGLQLLAASLQADPAELTAFQREVSALPPEEQQRALMVRLGLAPRAEAPNARQPASVQEYEYARQGGFQGSYEEFLGRRNPAPTTNVTVGGPNQDKFSERAGTILADEAATIAQSGAAAQGNLRSIERLDGLLQAAPSGAAAAFKLALGEYGIETSGLSDLQAAQALINQLVPAQRQPGSGPMSDADLALFKQSLPRIINTADGNRRIIETMRKIAEYDVQRGQIARQRLNGQLTADQAAAAFDALSNPLADFAAGERGPGTPIGGFAEIPGLKELSDDDLMRMLSGD